MYLERTQGADFIQWTGDNFDEVVAFFADNEDFKGTYFTKGPEALELVVDNNVIGVSTITVSRGSFIGVLGGIAREFTETELVDEWGYEPDVDDEDSEDE